MDRNDPKKTQNGGDAKAAPPQAASADPPPQAVAAVSPPQAAEAAPLPRVAVAPVHMAEAVHRRAEIDFAPAFPVLVEQMMPAGPGGAMTTGRGSGTDTDVGQQVQNALRDVLGWQPRSNDAKGFLGALTSSFDLREYEGHTEAKWKERRFAVQSDLSGGISGAQASLLTRARHAVEEAQPILAALYSLITSADPEEIEANRAIASQQLDELVGELGMLGGPRVARVDQIFAILLGDDTLPPSEGVELVVDPDKIEGALGNLRRLMGLGTGSEDEDGDGEDDDPDAFETRVNNIDEEQNVTNFRILADYVIGLRSSWDDNRSHFSRSRNRGHGSRFLGTQLVQLSRHLAVVAESVGEFRTILDSVFIGARERQTLEIVPHVRHMAGNYLYLPPPAPNELDALIARSADPPTTTLDLDEDEPFYLEELLSWIESFATREGPQLVEAGGKIGISGAFLQTAVRLRAMVCGARCPDNRDEIPDGYFTARVRRALHELEGHLYSLIREATNAPVKPKPSGIKARRAPAAGADK